MQQSMEFIKEFYVWLCAMPLGVEIKVKYFLADCTLSAMPHSARGVAPLGFTAKRTFVWISLKIRNHLRKIILRDRVASFSTVVFLSLKHQQYQYHHWSSCSSINFTIEAAAAVSISQLKQLYKNSFTKTGNETQSSGMLNNIFVFKRQEKNTENAYHRTLTRYKTMYFTVYICASF
jgi:hypothetical protein